MKEESMTKDLFEELFDRILGTELRSVGFTQKGRSLVFSQGNLQFGLLRAGGKLQIDQGITHILCLRHSFLREIKELSLPKAPPTVADSYPMLYNPETLAIETPEQWKNYHVDRFRPPYGSFFFGDADEEELALHLDRQVHQIKYRWLPWALTVTPENVSKQLELYKSDWWVARIWLEDYAENAA